MFKSLVATIAAAWMSAVAAASLGLTVDIYGPGDGATPQPDPRLVVVDILVAANPDNLIWTVSGIRVQTFNAATLVYAHDPNTGAIVPTNQGTANRFTTSFSRPRPRDGNGRFTDSGAAAVGR